MDTYSHDEKSASRKTIFCYYSSLESEIHMTSDG
jgi:hypothetical protein